MGLTVIFGLVAILAAYGTFRSFKRKNFFGAFWGAASFVVFGWFSIMTILHHGVPIVIS